MNLIMQSFIEEAACGNGGVYQGNSVRAAAPFTFRSRDLGAGKFEGFPKTANIAYYGFLRYGDGSMVTGGKLAVMLNGTTLSVLTAVDNKPTFLDSVVADNGDGSMNAPLSFTGFRLEIPGAGVLP